MRRWATLVCAVALVVAACGSDTTVEDTATVTDAVTAALVPAVSTAAPFTAESAACAAESLITAIGLPRMVEIVGGLGALGVGDPTAIFGQMTVDELAGALAAVEGCIDMTAAVADTFALYGFTPEMSTCLRDTLGPDHGKAIVESFLVGSDPTADPSFSAAFIDAMVQSCRAETTAMFDNDMVSYGISAEGASCVAAAFTAADNPSDIVSAWTGVGSEDLDPTAINDQITGIFTDCLTEEELGILGVDTSTTTTTTTTAP